MAEGSMASRMGRYESLKDAINVSDTTTPKQDLDRRSINDYISSLNHEQERLSELLDVLEDRIRDILGPQRPEKATLDGEGTPELSPMAHWLDGMVYRQDELRRRLAAIVERVEL